MLFFLIPGILPSYSPPDLPPYLWYPILLIAVILFIFLKVAGIVLSGNVFRTNEESSSYLLNLFLFNHVIGILLLPFMVYIVYTGNVIALKLTTVLLIILYIVRGVKGLIIGLTRSRFSPVLFLLYLCTLEIIPLLLMVKLVDRFA
jgi:hypothetical protein